MELFCTDQIVLMICGLEGNPLPSDSSYRCCNYYGLLVISKGLVKGFLCVFYLLYQFVYFVCFWFISTVCVELSVPVQVIAWKD